MKHNEFISIQQFCSHFNIPISFINALEEHNLVEFKIEKDEYYLHYTQVGRVEKIIRLHYDLDINLEGIDVISNLLDQMEALKEDIRTLNNKIMFYEDN